MIEQLATQLAKAGAPVLGGLIGTAIGGPAGAAIGGLAGRAIESLAETLGTDPTPEAVSAAIQNDPGAEAKIAAVEARSADLIRLWEIEAKRAADNDAAERERGFGAWQTRRTVTSYAVLLMLVASFGAALASAVGVIRADVALLTVLVGHGVTLFMAWNGLVSGGRAVKDAVQAWRGR